MTKWGPREALKYYILNERSLETKQWDNCHLTVQMIHFMIAKVKDYWGQLFYALSKDMYFIVSRLVLCWDWSSF